MRKISGYIAILLVLVLNAGIFAGCGKDTGIGGKNQTSQKSEPPITITWIGQNDGLVNNNSPLIRYYNEKFNIKLQFIYLERSNEVELLNIRIASGEIPDVMKLTDDRFRAYISQGVLAEIPEGTVKHTAPGLYDITLKNGGSRIWEFAKENRKLYGLPILNLNGAYQFVPVWRDDWLRNIGIAEIPGTLEQEEDAFYKFVNDDPDKNGKKDTYALSNAGMSVVFGAYGGIPYFSRGGGLGFTWSVVDGKVAATAAMPEMKEALALLNQWYKDGLIDPEFISEESRGQYWPLSVPFWNNKIGFTCSGMAYHWYKPFYEGDPGGHNYGSFVKLQPEGSYDFGWPLTGPTGKAGTERWGVFPGTYFVFGKQLETDTEKLERILEINEALVTDEDFFTESMEGVKDEMYTRDEEGNIQPAGIRLDPEKSKGLGLGNNGIAYMTANNFDFNKRKLAASYALADKIGNITQGYENAVWAGLPSYPQYKATVEKKIREAYTLFITGEKKLDEFDWFVEDLYKSGLEQLTKEANDWYSRYGRK